jgi:integrase
MPIPDVMLPWFDKMAQETGTFGLICPGKTGEPRAHDFTIRYIRRALKAVGLLEDITDHRLRASFANILNKKGVPLPTIQKLMRHSKIETTMIYIETHEDEMRSAINLMR